MKVLFTNIKELLQVRESDEVLVAGADMKILPTLKDAWLLIENDLIIDFGSGAVPKEITANKTIDCVDKMVMPTWCDSHTHNF